MRLQHGFSLVEVLVALLIFKVGLLGVVTAQILALKQVQDALQRTQAVALANGLLSDIQSNSQLAAVIGPQLTLSSELPPTTLCNADISCTPWQLAANQLVGWFGHQQAGTVAGLIDPIICLQHNGTSTELHLSWLRRTAGSEIHAGCHLTAGRSVLIVSGN